MRSHTMLTRRTAITGATALLLAHLAAPTRAAPIPYQLDAANSSVGFTFYLNGIAQNGTMPVSAAKISVDPKNLKRSTVDVSVSVSKARTGLLFATQALKGQSVLDASTYPDIRFVSRRILLAEDGRLSNGARIAGDVTLRGVTRPLTLRADLFRAYGSETNDLSRLNVHLRGGVNRSVFGATGYPDIVGDRVDLDITAAIRVATK